MFDLVMNIFVNIYTCNLYYSIFSSNRKDCKNLLE